MIHIVLISDGPRDEAVVPRLAERILDIQVRAEFSAWKSLHLGGNGYGRKLMFMVRRLAKKGGGFVIATIDSDKDSSKRGLREMERTVGEDPHCQGVVHVALGEANPHAEAWLLDDREAVRLVLRLEASHEIPTVRQVNYPKGTLDDLIGVNRGEDERLGVLAEISQELDPRRCRHTADTGFRRFKESLEQAFRNAFVKCPPHCGCEEECSTG